jgi:hypothetical protein
MVLHVSVPLHQIQGDYILYKAVGRSMVKYVKGKGKGHHITGHEGTEGE